MGGNSHGEGNVTVCGEFNFHANPEAAKAVIDRADCHVYITPWETCKNKILLGKFSDSSFKCSKLEDVTINSI